MPLTNTVCCLSLSALLRPQLPGSLQSCRVVVHVELVEAEDWRSSYTFCYTLSYTPFCYTLACLYLNLDLGTIIGYNQVQSIWKIKSTLHYTQQLRIFLNELNDFYLLFFATTKTNKNSNHVQKSKIDMYMIQDLNNNYYANYIHVLCTHTSCCTCMYLTQNEIVACNKSVQQLK